MRNGNHDTTNGNVMIFRYLGNGGRLTVSGEGMRGERMGEFVIRLSYLDEPQRIITFGRLSENLFAL
jgi:hypothetical protein